MTSTSYMLNTEITETIHLLYGLPLPLQPSNMLLEIIFTNLLLTMHSKHLIMFHSPDNLMTS